MNYPPVITFPEALWHRHEKSIFIVAISVGQINVVKTKLFVHLEIAKQLILQVWTAKLNNNKQAKECIEIFIDLTTGTFCLKN